ncbi:MAG: class I SAM-dependent methyltransferase [Leptolinea sp.]|nr:class I SAM-dependent methyltransferase [Leptolinea sp.]
MNNPDVKQQVRTFYDQVGWKTIGEGVYQNARYEDLRPVSREYIHRCHLRVNRFLRNSGDLLLDAGSGPVQYPEYLTYSEKYTHRVCLDISMLALKEARNRIGDHGLYVVADVANLPFKPNTFDGLVSLHTLHHLPLADQKKTYMEFLRVMKPDSSAVVVNGWTDSPLMRTARPFILFMERLGKLISGQHEEDKETVLKSACFGVEPPHKEPTGTFIKKFNPEWLKTEIAPLAKYEIFCWRSVNVRYLRAIVHAALGGKLYLKLLYRLEEWFPKFYGEKGQYPLIVLHK